MKEQTENSYRRRIDAVKSYVKQNLEFELTLDILARVASLSPYHFHRIFKTFTGESLGEYIQRSRIEKAAMALRSNPKMQLLDAALTYGYSSADGFRRAFKKVYGISPSKWNRHQPIQNRKIGREESKFPVYSEEELKEFASHYCWAPEIYSMQKVSLGVVETADAYQNFDKINLNYERVWEWYESNIRLKDNAVFLGYSYDDPELTPIEKCSFYWAAGPTDSADLIDGMAAVNFPTQKVVRIRLRGKLSEEDLIWQYLYRVWLPGSQYEPANSPAIEFYCKPPHLSDWKEFDLWCCVPIVRTHY